MSVLPRHCILAVRCQRCRHPGVWGSWFPLLCVRRCRPPLRRLWGRWLSTRVRATSGAGRWTTRRRQRRVRVRWRVRLGLLGGADVRPLRGVCGRTGRRQHGGGLGRSVCLRLCRAADGAGRVPFTRRRFGVRRSGVGLQRPGGRGRAESGPGGSASDPAGAGGRGFRPWRCGRSVRSADACGDTAVAVVTGCAVDGVSGRCVGRSAAVYRCGRSSGGGGRAVCACGGPRGAAAFAGEFAG